MSAGAKVYLICIDAFPEIPELVQVMGLRGLRRSELVCSGAFTCATLTSMISGCIGTEIVDGGIGYETLYKPSFYKWREGNCIIERLTEIGYDVVIHNHVPWFSKVIGGRQLTAEEQTKHYREHTVDHDDVTVLPFSVIKTDTATKITYSCTNPELTLNTFLKWNFPDEKKQFYENEREYINYIQKKEFNGLFLTDLCHWHEYVYYRQGQIKSDQEITKEDAISDTLNWLSSWDFNEPNSIFFIFADHSHRVNSYLDPQSHVTWVYHKDNMSGEELNPIISSNDFYRLVEGVFGLKRLERSKWLNNPLGAYDPLRVYAVEDSRSDSAKKDSANAFGRCCILKDMFISVVKLTDSTKNPSGLYLMISELRNKYTFTAYIFDDLNDDYRDSFSVICDGPLSERRINKNKHIYELNDEMILKARELYALI
jgi:hypothetical protein